MEIIILGIIQGIAEFLPISSSAHLIIFRDLFNIGSNLIGEIDMTFDLALHFGTLLAIIVYFFNELFKIVKDGLTKGNKTTDGKIFWYLVVATIPAGIVGVLFEDLFDEFFRKQIWLIAIALIVMGIIIYIVDKKSKTEKDFEKMTLKDAIIIGVSQVFALIPGFSRSGTTITAARALKMNREDSAKFSFLLSSPVILGAVCYNLIKPETFAIISGNLQIFGLGILVSFLTGLFCISFLLKYIKKHDFKVFMIYRIILGIVVLVYLSRF